MCSRPAEHPVCNHDLSLPPIWTERCTDLQVRESTGSIRGVQAAEFCWPPEVCGWKTGGRQRDDLKLCDWKFWSGDNRRLSDGVLKLLERCSPYRLPRSRWLDAKAARILLAGGDNAGPQTAIAPRRQRNRMLRLAKIEIAPVIGAPDNISRDLQTQLTSSMERNKISVARAPGGKGEYTLRGYIVAAREKTGSKISYIWDVTDQPASAPTASRAKNSPAGRGQGSVVGRHAANRAKHRRQNGGADCELASWQRQVSPSPAAHAALTAPTAGCAKGCSRRNASCC